MALNRTSDFLGGLLIPCSHLRQPAASGFLGLGQAAEGTSDGRRETYVSQRVIYHLVLITISYHWSLGGEAKWIMTEGEG